MRVKGSIVLPSLMILSVAFGANARDALPSASTPVSNAFSWTFDGRTEPEKIPAHVRYGMFVKRYLVDIRTQLIQELPAQDDAILRALATDDEQKSYAELLQYEQSMQKLCQRRTVRDAVSLAVDNQRIVDEFRARKVQRYNAAFNLLSPAGRQIVESFVEKTIVPSTRASLVDLVEWARQKPEEYLQGLAIDCHVAETGELPNWVRQRIEEHAQQTSHEATASSTQE